jgi:glycosyltransferase involved in cell wall biosynthesis
MNVVQSGRRPNIGMALFADATFDSRVRREAASLARAGFDVVLVCLADGGRSSDLPPSVRVIVRRPANAKALPGVANPYLEGQGTRARRALRRLQWLVGYIRNVRAWGRMAVDAAGRVDAWHVHDLPALAAIAPAIGRHVPIVFDSHELFLEAGTARKLPAPVRAFLRMHERRLVARSAAVVTVNESLAAVITHRYNPVRTVVVHNCPDRWTPEAGGPDLVRMAADIPEDAPVVLYHGSVGPGRGIEQLLDALLESGLERAHLVVMGPGVMAGSYRALASDPRWAGRVHVLEAVPPGELLRWVASADIGGVVIQRTTLNHTLATPNKLFECLAAGVPVIVSDFPTMRRIVMDHPGGPLGTACDPADPAAIAAAIRSILELDRSEVEALRGRCLRAARERWNWEHESAGLITLYADLLPQPPEPP